MKFPPVLYMIGVALSLTRGAEAQGKWAIDRSCQGEQNTFVRDAMNGALQMAGDALRATQQPNAAQQNLATWLFGTDRPGRAPVQQWLSDMFDDTFGINRLRQQVQPDARLSVYDVVLYCDRERLKRKSRFPSLWHDSDIDEDMLAREYSNCGPKTLMYTAHPVSHSIQVQICPWFLKYAMAQNYRFTTDFPQKLLAIPSTFWINIMKEIRFKKIDAQGLFDKVLLHELTHARAPNKDVNFRVIQTRDVGESQGYGWTNCRRLSTVTTQNYGQTSGEILGPEYNADSYTLFATAAWLLARGHAVDIDGGITD